MLTAAAAISSLSPETLKESNNQLFVYVKSLNSENINLYISKRLRENSDCCNEKGSRTSFASSFRLVQGFDSDCQPYSHRLLTFENVRWAFYEQENLQYRRSVHLHRMHHNLHQSYCQVIVRSQDYHHLYLTATTTHHSQEIHTQKMN